jgi:hypothetical protein
MMRLTMRHIQFPGHRAAACLALLLPLFALSAAAQASKSAALLCAPYYKELISAGKVTRTSDSGLTALLPQDPSSAKFRASIAQSKPGILVETAFFLPRVG